MTYARATVPDEKMLLCEGCGYVLDGLGRGARCPECGKPAAESDPELRRVCAWESGRSVGSFMRTTWEVLFRPANFYRHLAIRQVGDAVSFASIHFSISGMLLAAALAVHANWYSGLLNGGGAGRWVNAIPFIPLVFAVFYFGTELAGRLTAWEAAYRGLRMPLPVVRRAMYFHSAHYLPVALVTFLTIQGYQLALRYHWIAADTAPIYLYVLCAEIVVMAAYLFKTYWIGMKNIMYANA